MEFEVVDETANKAENPAENPSSEIPSEQPQIGGGPVVYKMDTETTEAGTENELAETLETRWNTFLEGIR